jgi:hypothetical protein
MPGHEYITTIAVISSHEWRLTASSFLPPIALIKVKGKRALYSGLSRPMQYAPHLLHVNALLRCSDITQSCPDVFMSTSPSLFGYLRKNIVPEPPCKPKRHTPG